MKSSFLIDTLLGEEKMSSLNMFMLINTDY